MVSAAVAAAGGEKFWKIFSPKTVRQASLRPGNHRPGRTGCRAALSGMLRPVARVGQNRSVYHNDNIRNDVSPGSVPKKCLGGPMFWTNKVKNLQRGV